MQDQKDLIDQNLQHFKFITCLRQVGSSFII